MSEHLLASQPNYLPDVRGQYEDLPYPPRDPQDELTRVLCSFSESLDRINHFCFGGQQNFDASFRFLLAGGGTGDSTIWLAEQTRDNGNEIIHLDLSAASIAVAKERAKMRGLEDRIRFIQGSLLDLPKMHLGTFDFINCCGVLHHLADPAAGLAVLKSVLAAGGAMGLMVYGQYGRTGVYQMQETLRLLTSGIDSRAEKIAVARELVSKLISSHWFTFNKELFAAEMETDSGLFDMLLHTQDRAYTVPELYEWVEGCGLVIQAFLHIDGSGELIYNPARYLAQPALRERVAKMPKKQQQALAEVLYGRLLKHSFYVLETPRALPSASDETLIPDFSMLRRLW